ncbi:glycosyltransferase [Legionella erythra]|uniref:Glycosyl transferases group 1 n=1 Tax=Legionella erythra TaxID=448 RepID=A0A0W0TJ96_LEGER|nr:glycosyltransferase [Legionella erythra]KTC95687.1 hypothetical protein Lery_1982 [Legionella erythra]
MLSSKILKKYDKSLIKMALAFISSYVKVRGWLFGRRKSVLFAGQCYYNGWYLSRALRQLGWRADVLNWDSNPHSQIYYHGEDFRINCTGSLYTDLKFYLKSLLQYEVFHFSNTNGIQFGTSISSWFKSNFGEAYEIHVLKKLNKKIVYTNNGCLDGVSQSSFSKWDKTPVCNICIWKHQKDVCSDSKNLAWGIFRNQIADYQCLFGGNRTDYNAAPTVHEVPEVYCLNAEIWHPDIEVPENFKIRNDEEKTYVYHAVGNKRDRTKESGVNIKSTHVYLPLIKKFQDEGLKIELISPEGIANRDIRYYQVQADIFLDMLSYGWYGATAREAMMLAKPVICYIRPEWLESLRAELPECADELPIISALPDTVEDILRDLILNPQKRIEIGQKSREFCLKWHSDTVAAKRFDQIYSRLLAGDLQLLN